MTDFQDAEMKERLMKYDGMDTKRDSSWPSVLFYIHLNVLGLYGILVLFTQTSFLTVVFTIVLSLIGILGTTLGSHRLWAHKTYKANDFLRFCLMLAQTMSGQVSMPMLKMHFDHSTYKI